MSTGLEHFEYLLKSLAQQASGVADVSRLFDTGEIRIGQRTIDISYKADEDNEAKGTLLCRAEVVRFLALQAEGTYRLLLQANYLWSGTHGATLGLHGRDVVIISAARRVGPLDVAKLIVMLTSLARDAQLWSFALGRPADLLSLTQYATPAFAYRS